VVALLLVISCLKQKAKLPSNSLPHFLSIWNTQPIYGFTCPSFQPFPGYQLVKEHKNEGKVRGTPYSGTRYSHGSNEF
jgi:hypothetical protein